MEHSKKKFSLSGVVALLMFALFSAAVLLTLLAGTGAYSRLTQRNQDSYESRTALQYMATKLRQAPGLGAVTVAPFGDGDALMIAENMDGIPCLTRIYCYDGWLMELFSLADGSFSPEDGEKLVPMARLSLDLEHALITVRLTDAQGTVQETKLYMRGSEVQP